jgi:hypothetical protein
MIDTLYILSAGRSGSTLLNLVLGSHSQAVAVSELTQLPDDIRRKRTCSCGERIHECSYWQQVAAQIREQMGIDAWRDPYSLRLGYICDPRRQNLPPVTARYRLAWKIRHGLVYLGESGLRLPRWTRREFDTGIRNTHRLHDIVRAVSGRPVVVDASKSYLKGLALYLERPRRTRLILLSRDGRASFYSRLRDGYGRNQSLKAWRNYYRHALPLLERRVPREHVIHVKYEDFASDPAGQLERICAFAGLAFEPAMLDLSTRVQHVTSGNDMRMATKVRIRPDTAWRTGLRPADSRFFETWAGATNRRLGYE